jgi:hypothetical protein
MRRFRMVMLGALSLVGCGTAEPDSVAPPTGDTPDERQMTLLAEATPESGRTVKFFEAFEGFIVLGQTFPFGAQPLKMPDGMPAAEFFQQLAGKPAPQGLVDADVRHQRMVTTLATTHPAQAQVRPVATATVSRPAATATITRPADTSNQDPDVLYAIDDAYPAQTFQANYCSVYGVCDYLKTVPFERKAYDVITGEAQACAYTSTQLLTGGYHVWWGSWTSLGYVSFSAGSCASIGPLHYNWVDFDFAASVRRSGNSPMGYHFHFYAF